MSDIGGPVKPGQGASTPTADPIPPRDKKPVGRAGHPNELRTKVLAMIREGTPQDQVSAKTGVHVRTIINWRKQAGMPVLPLGPRPVKKPYAGPELEAKVAALRAEGIPVKDIARALHIDWHRVSGILKEPSTQIEITRRRELAKSIASEALPSITAKAYGLAEQTLNQGDAKAFDATARGLYNLEKVGASVSGEARMVQVEHSGSVETTGQPTAVEQLNILIQAVMGR